MHVHPSGVFARASIGRLLPLADFSSSGTCAFGVDIASDLKSNGPAGFVFPASPFVCGIPAAELAMGLDVEGGRELARAGRDALTGEVFATELLVGCAYDMERERRRFAGVAEGSSLRGWVMS